jgi:hypothetical protein
MNTIQKEILSWLTIASNIAFAIGIGTVILYLKDLIPPSEQVLLAYQFIAVSSPFIVGLTLIRWVTKAPESMTWLQSAYGVTALCTWGYSWMMLVRLYMAEGTSTNVIAAMLVAPIAPLSAFVVYLTYKAYKNNFKY